MMFVAFGVLALALLATRFVGFGSLILVFLAVCGVMLLVMIGYHRRNREAFNAPWDRPEGEAPLLGK